MREIEVQREIETQYFNVRNFHQIFIQIYSSLHYYYYYCVNIYIHFNIIIIINHIFISYEERNVKRKNVDIEDFQIFFIKDTFISIIVRDAVRRAVLEGELRCGGVHVGNGKER